MSASDRDSYRAVSGGVAFRDRSDRVRLEVRGPDRARFLHNLTTNEVKGLAVGRGREAFVTSLQGKTLAFVVLLASEDHILVRADPDGLAIALPHLQKYGVFDDVVLDDAGARTFEFHLAGPDAEEVVKRSGIADLPGGGEFDHQVSIIAEVPVRLVRESPTGRPGLTLIGPVERALRVADQLHGHGGWAEIGRETWDALRIEAGIPVFGRDLTPENLPQELDRDARAINFVKGCYLGQETVARIDALGHVNKVLKGLIVEHGDCPGPGAALVSGGKALGTVTSSAFSPGWGRPLALAYIRASHAQAGTAVAIVEEGGSRAATVADLPMLPPEPH